MSLRLGDRFRVQIVVDDVDYGMGEAQVIHIDERHDVATLVAHGRKDPRTGNMPIQEVFASVSILERIQHTGEPEMGIGTSLPTKRPRVRRTTSVRRAASRTAS